MMTNERLLSCISRQEDGQYTAQYDNFTLRSVFQPIYKKDISIVGLEALVRINLPDGTEIRPDLFFHSKTINISDKLDVERLSSIIHIKNFAQSRFRNNKLFLNILPVAAEMIVKVPKFGHVIQKTFSFSGLKQKQVVMELTELGSGNETFLYKATEYLSNNGFQLAIDDYGVNASTIERVKSVRPDIIKMDRSLLLMYEDGNQSALLEALHLSRKLGAQTVIEGIETEYQLNLMKTLGFDMYQGYLLALPQTLERYDPAKIA
ncbi:EAL domain-containing protein [Vibrio mytili]|uniref:EAL domain-containing protein n=1 Tax=Vibrio mytili TaxID=50718 RepID=UPI002F42D4AD